jgi:hypothetical protein
MLCRAERPHEKGEKQPGKYPALDKQRHSLRVSADLKTMFAVKQPSDPEISFPPDFLKGLDGKKFHGQGGASPPGTHGHVQLLPGLPVAYRVLISTGMAGEITSAFQTFSGDALIRIMV